MAQTRVFSLMLDPNLRCHVNKSALRANPTIKSSQIISCGSLDLFLDSLHQVREETTLCIISTLTNFLASADGPSTLSLRVDPVLQVRHRKKCY